MGDRCQIHIADPVAELPCQICGDMHSQARLARSAGSGQGDQPIARQHFIQALDFRLAPNKIREVDRKIMGDIRAGCAQRREVVAQIGMT